MATHPPDDTAAYEATRTPQTPHRCGDTPIKEEPVDDNYSGFPKCWAEAETDGNSMLHVTNSCSNAAGESPEEKPALECSSSEIQNEMRAYLSGVAKADCPAMFEAIKVKHESEQTWSEPAEAEAGFEQSYGAVEYKIDVNDHVLTSDPDQDIDCKRGIEKSALADARQTQRDGYGKIDTEDDASYSNKDHEQTDEKYSPQQHNIGFQQMNEDSRRAGHGPDTADNGDGLQKLKQNGSDVTRFDVNMPLFYCAHCKYSATKKSHILQHITTAHGKDVGVHKCRWCEFTTRSRYYLYTHARTKHKSDAKIHNCSECRFSSKYKAHLDRHASIKHNPNPNVYACSKCDFATKHRGSLYLHAKAIHSPDSETYACSHCQFTTKVKQQLSRHVSRKHDLNAPVYQCSRCDFATKYKLSLSQHTTTNHSLDAATYKCSECRFATKHRNYLAKHVRMKHKPVSKTYRCTQCEHTTIYKAALRGHVETTHNPDAEVYECSKCDYATKQKTLLTRHVRVKHSFDPDIYKCAKCPYTTAYKTVLLRHADVIHNPDATSYRCSECGFVSKYKNALSRHARKQHNLDVGVCVRSERPDTAKVERTDCSDV